MKVVSVTDKIILHLPATLDDLCRLIPSSSRATLRGRLSELRTSGKVRKNADGTFVKNENTQSEHDSSFIDEIVDNLEAETH